jgi:N-acetyltransferase
MKLDFCAMEGRFVRLEPVTLEVKEQMRALVESDPEAWTTLTVNPMVQGFDVYWLPMIEGAATGQRHAYVIRRISDHRVIGTSSFMSMRLSQRGVEIGATFLRPDARGGYANPESKLLMLEHAFSSGAVRVEFMVDSANAQSGRALFKLGAGGEGLLRNRKIAWNEQVRDVTVFSIVDGEWSWVRDRLRERLATFGTLV